MKQKASSLKRSIKLRNPQLDRWGDEGRREEPRDGRLRLLESEIKKRNLLSTLQKQIKKDYKKYYEQLYASKLGILLQMEKFLERHKGSKLTEE